MRQVDPPRLESPPKSAAYPYWQVIPIVLCAVLLAVVLAVFRTRLRALDIFSAFLLFGAAVLSILIVLYTRSLRRAQEVQLDTEERLQQMADNIQEIFWMIDAETKKALYVTEAYETITGRSCQSLLENPSSYEELIHPEDRVHVLAKLGEATQTGHFDERFRIVRPRGEVRWVTVHGFPVRDAAGKIHRLVGTVREITAQKEAEDKVAEHLAAAESARAESDALNKATLALTADLRMDFVLDRLLESLLELVPCECARVLLLEGDTQLLVAREKLRHEVPKKDSGLSTDSRRSRLSVPLAHINGPEQCLACRHQSTRKNGPASRAIPTFDHGFACRWLRPSRPWGFFQWATPSQTLSLKTTFGGHSYWRSPPRRRSRILASTSALKSLGPNFSGV